MAIEAEGSKQPAYIAQRDCHYSSQPLAFNSAMFRKIPTLEASSGPFSDSCENFVNLLLLESIYVASDILMLFS